MQYSDDKLMEIYVYMHSLDAHQMVTEWLFHLQTA